MNDRVRCERISYRGWNNSYLIANRDVEIIIVADVGPRVLSFRRTDGENQFYIIAEQAGLQGGTDRRLYGGHRLWTAPERVETFVPDNEAVEITRCEGTTRFTAPHSPGPEGTTLQRSVEISLDASGSHCRVTHRIANTGDKPCDLSPWAITMLLPGGKATVPLGQRRALSESSLQPEQAIVLWPYSDLSDCRWRFWQTYIEFGAKAPAQDVRFRQQKFGIRSQAGWAAYLRNNTLFVKRSGWQPEREYPDLGCNYEVYAENGFLELESLGPVERLTPSEVATHVEDWWLVEGVADGSGDDWFKEEISRRVADLKELPELGDATLVISAARRNSKDDEIIVETFGISEPVQSVGHLLSCVRNASKSSFPTKKMLPSS